jgi:hypothetical protein
VDADPAIWGCPQCAQSPLKEARSEESAADILRQAAETIEQRGNERDTEDGERSMDRAVEAYRALKGDRIRNEADGWDFMVLLKLSRASEGAYQPDDRLDMTAYAALAAECEAKNQG